MISTSLSQRVLGIEESPTLAVTAKAKALRAAGEPVIGFGAGEPDAGGTVVVVPTDQTTGFRAGIEALESVRSDRTKALVFASPSNPTGAVYTPAEVQAIGEWAGEHGIWVITDEIYEHLVYGDAEMASLPVVAPEVGAQTIIVNGVAKTYAMTGWRVGWSVAPIEIAQGINRLQSQVTSNVNNVAQIAVLEALAGPQHTVAAMREAFDRRRRLAVTRLDAIDGVSCVEPQGAFYVFPSFEGVLGREIEGQSVQTTLDLAQVLLDAAQVAVVPGEAFGMPGYARLSYALGDDDLVEGIARIAVVLSGHPS